MGIGFRELLIILAIALVIVAAVGFMVYQSEQSKDNAIEDAAGAVGDAAKDVGDAVNPKS